MDEARRAAGRRTCTRRLHYYVSSLATIRALPYTRFMFATVHPKRGGNSIGAGAPARWVNGFATARPDGLFSGREITFSVTDKVISVGDQPFSMTEKPFSATDNTFSIADKPFSATEITSLAATKPSPTRKKASPARRKVSPRRTKASPAGKSVSQRAKTAARRTFSLSQSPPLPLFPSALPSSHPHAPNTRHLGWLRLPRQSPDVG